MTTKLFPGRVEIPQVEVEARGLSLGPWLPLCETCQDRDDWTLSFLVSPRNGSATACRMCGTPTTERASTVTE